MQNVILGLLMLAPMSLYDLHRAFTQGISLFYSASFGSIQRALRQLLDGGLVTAEPEPGNPRGKKVHTIAPAGRRAFHEWMRVPITGGDAETAMLARVFFLGLIEDKGERDRVVTTLRSRVAGDLADLRAAATTLDAQTMPEEFAGVFRFQRATLDYGLQSHELALQWLDGLGHPVSTPRSDGSSGDRDPLAG